MFVTLHSNSHRMKVEETLFSILRSEMWQTPLELCLSEDELNDVLRHARRQTVLGMTISTFIRNKTAIPRETLFRLLAYWRQIKQTNVHIDEQLARFTEFMRSGGVDFVVVKGQTVACCYPHPEVRQAGDVDFYCDSENFSRAASLLQDTYGIVLSKDSRGKHDDFDIEGVHYEIHRRLNDFAMRRHQNYWDALLAGDEHSYVNVNGVEVPTLSVTSNALFIFVHIFYHFIVLGVGLRQFCDLAMYLHVHRESIDRALLEKHLRGVGLFAAYRAVGALLVDHLGLPEDDFPFTLSARDHRRAQRLVPAIFNMGNFGHSVKRHFRGKLMHTIETGIITYRHAMRFLPIAPGEVFFNLRRMTLGFFNSDD